MKTLSIFLFVIFMTGCQATNNQVKSSNPFQDMTAIKSPEEIASHPLGSSGNPIRVYNPSGERDYLLKLKCSDGSKITFRRNGSAGIGPYGNILDSYQVTCFINSELKEYNIYMDMYYPNYQETRPASGFIQ